jgi:hypothetical protein
MAATADVGVSEKIRELLYAPETGYLTLNQSNAVSGYKTTKEQIEALQSGVLEGVPDSVRERLEPALARRIDGALQKMTVHLDSERGKWLDGASDARIGAAAEDALTGYSNDREINGHLLLGASEIRNKAERLGWSSEQTAAAEVEYVSGTLKAIVFRRAQDDPSAALAYAERNASRLAPGDLAYIQEIVGKEAKTQQGRQWAQSYGASPATITGAINREFVTADGHSPDLSGIRPDVMDKFARLQGELGVTLAINSGFRDPKRNANAGGAKKSQHMHGSALDIDVSDMKPSERVEVIQKASALGFTGIGVYNNAIHLDVGPKRYWGPSHGKESLPTWAKATIQMHMAGGFARAPESGGTPENAFEAAMKIKDDDVRASALSELSKMQQISNAADARQTKAARDELWQLVEAGTDPADAPAEVRRAAGRADVSAAESYFLSKTTGASIKTDPDTYIDLRNMPRDEFLATDLRQYRDRLSNSDYAQLGVLQGDMQKEGPVKERGLDAMLGPARRIFDMRGIVKGEAGSEQAKEYARLETQVIRSVDQWERENPGKQMPRGMVMDLADQFAGTYRAAPALNDVEMTPASLRSAAQPYVRASIGTAAKEPEKIAAFEAAHLEAARAYRARTGEDPSTAVAADIAREMVGSTFHIDSGGVAGLFSGDNKLAYEVTADDLDGLRAGRITIENEDGRKITADDLAMAARAFKNANGRLPEIYELMSLVAE